MKRKWLITGISTIAVILLTLSSLPNIVGYQTVKSSNQQTIKETVNKRELLFQTIVDIANNKEIQRIILKSQMSRGEFLVSNVPVLTKNQLKQIYFIGSILSKIISTTRMQSIVGKHLFRNQMMQSEIFAVIEKDATLKGEITQLSNSECDCEKQRTTRWRYPIICSMLSILSFGLGVTFVFFDHIISDGKLGNNEILVLIAVLTWLEVGSLWVTVDCLIDIYCEIDLSIGKKNTT